MGERKILPAMTLQLTAACIMVSFVFATGWEQLERGMYYPLVLLPYALLMYPLNRLFLRRERSMRALVLFNGACAAALFLSIVLSGDYGDWASLVFAGAFCVYLTVRASRSAMEAPGLRSSMMSMELCLVTLVLFTAWCGISALPVIWCAPAVLGCAAAVLGVMFSRMEGSPGPRGWAFIVLAFALIFLLLWLLVSFAAAPAGQGLVAAWDAAVSLVKYILGLIWRFLLFLVSLIPQTEIEGYEMEYKIITPPEMQEPGASDGYILGALALIAVAALVIALVRLLIRLGRIRIGGKRAPVSARRQRMRPTLRMGLRRMLASVWAGLRLRLDIWKQRNMPAGLLCILIRRCRLGPWHKRTGETPREFLTRLRDAAAGDSMLYEALDKLIPAVDKAIYDCAHAAVPVENASLIRRRIGAAVRRDFVRGAAGNLRARLNRT